MLHFEEAELAEALSRLCVLRTEDYYLLKSIRKLQKKKPDPAYLSLLMVEFRKREQWRSEREVDLLSQLDTWEYNFFSEYCSTEMEEWKNLGPLTSVYVECIRGAYQLQPSDLTQSPFVTLDSSQFLYSCAPKSPLHRAGYHEVLQMFDPSRREESRRTHAAAMVDTLYPLQRDLRSLVREMLLKEAPVHDSSPLRHAPSLELDKDGTLSPSSSLMRATLMEEVTEVDEDIINSHVKPIVRTTLRSSRKVWEVLFLLWKHLLIRCSLKKIQVTLVDDFIARALSTTAGNFLNTQRCRFVSLLEATDTMHKHHSN